MANSRCLRRLEKLRSRFADKGIRPSTRMGQNFLLDVNQVNLIARLADAGGSDVLLEVGPGTGFLSRALCDTGALVLGVELDRKLGEYVKAEMADYPNFLLMAGDILAGKNAVNPEVLSTLRELLKAKKRMLSRQPGKRSGKTPQTDNADKSGAAARPEPILKCVSNLPYSAGTPFVMNLLSSDLPWERGVFLLQYEVAARLCASPGDEAYGTLSIGAALAAKVKIARKVPPTVFWPRPKVDSAVVVARFLPAVERMSLPWAGLRRITSAVFGARRKNLKNALKGVFAKDALDAALASAGLDPERRGETLTPDEFLALARLPGEDFPGAS